MAQSRLEKVGTIYTRIQALLKTGALKEENKPMWFDIFAKFPPKYEPTFSRKCPEIQLKQIFYREDVIRAKFHKDFKRYSMVNLIDKKAVSRTEQFLKIYNQLEKEGVPQEELYDKAVEEFLSKIQSEPKPQYDADSSAVSKPKVIVKTRKGSTQDVAADQAAQEAQDAENREKYKPIRLRIDKIMELKEESNEDIAADQVTHEAQVSENKEKNKPIRLKIDKIMEDDGETSKKPQ